MTHEQILTKAIEKAIAGGWSAQFSSKKSITVYGLLMSGDPEPYRTYELDPFACNDIIFNHDFARALWGEKQVYRAEIIESPEEGAAGYDEYCNAWEYHLQQMVIADDPIKYLAQHI